MSYADEEMMRDALEAMQVYAANMKELHEALCGTLHIKPVTLAQMNVCSVLAAEAMRGIERSLREIEFYAQR